MLCEACFALYFIRVTVCSRLRAFKNKCSMYPTSFLECISPFRRRLRSYPLPLFASILDVDAFKARLPYFHSSIRLPLGVSRRFKYGISFGSFVNLCKL